MFCQFRICILPSERPRDASPVRVAVRLPCVYLAHVGSIVPELSMLSLSDEESLREARKTLSNYFSPENKKQFTAVYEYVRACRDVLTDKDLRTWLDFFEPDNYRKISFGLG